MNETSQLPREVRMSGRAVLGAKSSQLRRAPHPGAPVIEVRCDVLLGSVTVRRPTFLMARRGSEDH